jgi:hypothetical protein
MTVAYTFAQALRSSSYTGRSSSRKLQVAAPMCRVTSGARSCVREVL